jgi:predicted O-linked N-acetylglucosamine transferase (SPINDLY family)
MAYRPAPVQIYWLGYPFTCGLPSVDYILLDGRVAPPAGTDFLVEEPLLMPRSWVCYDPFETATFVGDLPFDRNGFITFGTLNNPYKFTRAGIAAWAGAMRRVPRSRHMFVHPEYRFPVITENLMREFERNGIARDRLCFINNRERAGSHFEYYNEFDMTLDSFPLTGGTSTCDALWMGVPVISRVGPGIHQRLSYSLLGSAGLDALCVETDEAFVEAAVALAGDTARLRALRGGMRDAVRGSTLGQADRFGREFCNLMSGLVERHGLRGSPPSEPASETHSASRLHVPLLRLH